MGDPIEVGALGHALNETEDINHTEERAKALVSVKSHFGHTEGAAGLSGALLAVHCLANHQKPAVRAHNIVHTMLHKKATGSFHVHS